MKSLLDEVNDIMDQIEKRQRENRFAMIADRLFWAVMGASIMMLYIGFRWRMFQYLISEAWNKLFSMVLS